MNELINAHLMDPAIYGGIVVVTGIIGLLFLASASTGDKKR